MEKEQKKLSKLESELAGKTEECLSLQKIVLELQQRVQVKSHLKCQSS